MKNRIKFLSAVIVLFVIFGCGFLADKVEEKVSEEIDQQVKESERRLDSIMESTDMDSLQRQLDSVMQDIDKTNQQIDSLDSEIKKRK